LAEQDGSECQDLTDSSVTPPHSRELQTFGHNLLASGFDDATADRAAVSAVLRIVHEPLIPIEVTFRCLKVFYAGWIDAMLLLYTCDGSHHATPATRSQQHFANSRQPLCAEHGMQSMGRCRAWGHTTFEPFPGGWILQIAGLLRSLQTSEIAVPCCRKTTAAVRLRTGLEQTKWCVPLHPAYPPTDLLDLGQSTENPGDGGPPTSFVEGFGPRAKTMAEWKELGRELSPIYHSTAKRPPTFIVHGDADTLVPLDQSRRFMKEAEKYDMKLRLDVEPGGGHGWPTMMLDMSVLLAGLTSICWPAMGRIENGMRQARQ
jgi:hypothetical protein